MPLRTISPPPLNHKKSNKSSPGASTTGYELPTSPSLLSEEGIRQRSPRVDVFSEKNTGFSSPQPDDNNNVLKPYIGLRSKLSLAWVNYPVIALVFIILRLFYASRSVEPIIENVKDKARQSCDALEVASSTVTSLPHFMASGFNRSTIDGVNLAVKGVERVLDLMLVTMEAIISWIVRIFINSYKCLLEFASGASTGTLSESVRVLGDFTNGQLNSIKSQLDTQISGINSALDGLRSAVEKVGGVFGSKLEVPKVTLSTDALSNLQLPTTNIVNGLDSLGDFSSISDIENKVTSIFQIPFEQLRGTVKGVMSGVTFNETLLPVPPTNKISFCADKLDLSVLDDISRDLVKAAYIGIAAIILVMLLMIIANAGITWFSHFRYKLFIRKVTRTTELLTIKSNKDAVIEITRIAEHPFLIGLLIRLSLKFKSLENRTLFRWFVDYVLHKPSLICLIIGLSGLMGVYLEVAILNAVKQSYRQPVADTISNFGNSVESLINSQLSSASGQFASDSNNAIGTLENDLNQELLGWVNITTTTLNNTLNTAVDDITNFVQTTFKDVPILLPIVQQLVNCLIIAKIEGIQAGLTFISNNAFIGLPRVSDNILLISDKNMNEVVGQVTDKLVGSNSDGGIGGEIGKIFDVYESNIRSDLPLYWTLVFVWIFVILMGICRILWFKYQKRRNHNPPSVSQNDISQFSKNIIVNNDDYDDDDHKGGFRNFCLRVKKKSALKFNHRSKRNATSPTFPNYRYPPQPVVQIQGDTYNNNNNNNNNYNNKENNNNNNPDNPFTSKKYRPPPPPPPPRPSKLSKSLPLDIRNNNADYY